MDSWIEHSIVEWKIGYSTVSCRSIIFRKIINISAQIFGKTQKKKPKKKPTIFQNDQSSLLKITRSQYILSNFDPHSPHYPTNTFIALNRPSLLSYHILTF
jgi:hypothetical protein